MELKRRCYSIGWEFLTTRDIYKLRSVLSVISTALNLDGLSLEPKQA